MISPYTAKQACPDCGGKGWIERKCLNPDEARVGPHCNGSGLTPLVKECPSGPGSGQIETRTVERQSCAKCYGSGRYPPPESL